MSAAQRSTRRSAGTLNRVSSRASEAGGSNGCSGNAVISSYQRACRRTWARHSLARRAPAANAGTEAPRAKKANSTSCAASVIRSKRRANASVGSSTTLIQRNSVRLTV
ncbi:hypothetical protein GA0115253_110374 [Streptomyces sp. Termitarium-T10T-6]|nr:hypothetical protein [Streptomyces sp. Termitarium-T10T-6]SCE62341.1 hypothetical protein GA0115253_110374 [Streptomyces sp. Termitarium-T10T-6]